MSKVTSKLQVTIPKAIADQYGIEPGDEIEFQPAGGSIRVVPGRSSRTAREPSIKQKLKQFDDMMRRFSEWERTQPAPSQIDPRDRGWTREELYAERTGRYPG